MALETINQSSEFMLVLLTVLCKELTVAKRRKKTEVNQGIR